jgi:hypothetical protein
MRALFEDMQPWVKQQGGALSMTDNQWDALQILINGPAGMQMILVWGGDDAKGDQPQSPLADEIIELLVGYNLGLQAEPGAALIKNKPNRPSLLKLVNDARARLLAARFPEGETEQALEYMGTPPVAVDGMPLKAYRIRAKLGAVVEVDAECREIGNIGE